MLSENEMWDDFEDMIASLEYEGCIERIEVDAHGERQFFFDFDKMDILHPQMSAELQAEHQAEVDEALSSLVDKGLIEMYVQPTPDGGIEAVYRLSEDGRRYAEQELDSEQ
jgi:DNA-binding MarR family transcriptional regulator